MISLIHFPCWAYLKPNFFGLSSSKFERVLLKYFFISGILTRFIVCTCKWKIEETFWRSRVRCNVMLIFCPFYLTLSSFTNVSDERECFFSSRVDYFYSRERFFIEKCNISFSELWNWVITPSKITSNGNQKTYLYLKTWEHFRF